MDADYALREPMPGDVDLLARFHVEAWRQTYADLLPESCFDTEALQRRRFLWAGLIAGSDDASRLRLAERRGAIVGFAIAGRSRDTKPARALELAALYVASEHHGTGVAQSLLDATLGTEPSQLWVFAENPRAHAFYRRNGFAYDGATRFDPHHGPEERRMVH